MINCDTNVISHDSTISNTSLHSTTTVTLETVNDISIFSTQRYLSQFILYVSPQLNVVIIGIIKQKMLLLNML